ncbi:MAG: hypothetical protein C5B59_08845 [Bacteroidetes bacterium]|nr:MAG: hypothetical protein C5B59_08845 [Bacteroidota bacterium]
MTPEQEEFTDRMDRIAGLFNGASNKMDHAVMKLDDSNAAFIQFLDSWMTRLESVVARLEKK